ncbi:MULTISPECIES: translation initiation factor Sui1 [unclassified Roseateles]|uniref:translation initiation factor Sui1 n=1 Tax=unclassified Roseateles TaxID=2626991 RepID=UPI0006FA9B5F|nr:MULTISPECIES: translation initiation factor Sui1 [unclassified Roseateles]KQW51941.1 translation initiation factor SUI1 [Pelomonas sp. Root405]KRA78174.1 translation initiation factor SUI1 [Pelomonas sp. Root662]
MSLVYSTDVGRVCPGCSQPVAQCTCKAKTRPAGDGIVRVSRETAGRKGKGVTVIKGLPLDDAALTACAKQLKALCGSGGTVKDGVVEIQGDHLDKVLAWLKARPEGWTVKRAGG